MTELIRRPNRCRILRTYVRENTLSTEAICNVLLNVRALADFKLTRTHSCEASSTSYEDDAVFDDNRTSTQRHRRASVVVIVVVVRTLFIGNCMFLRWPGECIETATETGLRCVLAERAHRLVPISQRSNNFRTSKCCVSC